MASELSQAQMIETLWTRAEIERVMLNFGRALDTGDWKLYRSCFADRFRVNFERLTGQPESMSTLTYGRALPRSS